MKRPSRARRARSPRTEPGERELVRIDSIGAGGEGVGRLQDGRVVFVHRTAPGDLVEVGITRQRPRWARGDLLAVREASSDRREPPCPLFGACGGCTVEHLLYPAQLAAKARIVSDALTRIGGRVAEAPEVVASPREFRYRNRVSFSLRRGPGESVVAGFHRLGDPDSIVDVGGECLLPEEPISRAWVGLRAAWGPGARLLPAGDGLRLTLRATADGAISLLVEGGTTAGRPEELVGVVPGLKSVWHRTLEGSRAQLVAGSESLLERWGEEDLELSGTAFLQVNRDAAGLLEDHVLDMAGDVDGRDVVDAYCGVGFHARRLARRGARVTGIELDADAVRAARAGGDGNPDFRSGPVETLLPDVLPAELVILNPPRGGIAPAVAAALAAVPPARVIYISCDPATLARDLARLGDAFELRSVRSFDLFPQTAHVETVATLARSAPSSPPVPGLAA